MGFGDYSSKTARANARGFMGLIQGLMVRRKMGEEKRKAEEEEQKEKMAETMKKSRAVGALKKAGYGEEQIALYEHFDIKPTWESAEKIREQKMLEQQAEEQAQDPEHGTLWSQYQKPPQVNEISDGDYVSRGNVGEGDYDFDPFNPQANPHLYSLDDATKEQKDFVKEGRKAFIEQVLKKDEKPKKVDLAGGYVSSRLGIEERFQNGEISETEYNRQNGLINKMEDEDKQKEFSKEERKIYSNMTKGFFEYKKDNTMTPAQDAKFKASDEDKGTLEKIRAEIEQRQHSTMYDYLTKTLDGRAYKDAYPTQWESAVVSEHIKSAKNDIGGMMGGIVLQTEDRYPFEKEFIQLLLDTTDENDIKTAKQALQIYKKWKTETLENNPELRNEFSVVKQNYGLDKKELTIDQAIRLMINYYWGRQEY